MTRVLNSQEVLTGALAWHQGLLKKQGKQLCMLKQQGVQDIITLLGRKSTQDVHRQQEPASGDWVQFSRNLCTEGGQAEKWHNTRDQESSTYTHAHTCTRSL